jgi:hypothetical protein
MNLQRDVAIKILPAMFASNIECIAQFSHARYSSPMPPAPIWTVSKPVPRHAHADVLLAASGYSKTREPQAERRREQAARTGFETLLHRFQSGELTAVWSG